MHDTPAAGPAPCEPEWRHRPLSALVAHISGSYHDQMRDELPRLWRQMVDVVGQCDGGAGSTVRALASLVAELRDQVETHAWTEEDVLLPALVAREHPAVLGTRVTAETLTRLLDTLEREHEAIRQVLASILTLVRDLAPLASSDAAVAAVLSRLARARDRLVEGLDLEDRCLLPRARELARVGSGCWRYR